MIHRAPSQKGLKIKGGSQLKGSAAIRIQAKNIKFAKKFRSNSPHKDPENLEPNNIIASELEEHYLLNQPKLTNSCIFWIPNHIGSEKT